MRQIVGIRTLYLDIEDENVCSNQFVWIWESLFFLLALEIGFIFANTCLNWAILMLFTLCLNQPSEYPVEKWGPFLECHSRLKERSNVEFVQVVSQDRLRLRIWERGSGETLSCGTGACAAVVCAIQQKGLENKVLAEVPGGTLTISWNGNGEAVFLSGPAEFVFDVTVHM